MTPDFINSQRLHHAKQLQKADRLGQKGDHAGAERIWRKYIKECPHDPVVLFNLGVAVKERATTAELAHEAGMFFTRVVENPAAELTHKADALNNLGILASKAGYMDRALTAYSFALKISPEHSAATINYGDCLRCLGDWKGADDCYQKIARANPDSAEAHYSSGFIALLMGDLKRGWPEYRWRHKLQACQTKPIVTTRPMWNGEPLEGKILMLTEEQGFGDSFMFIRYARPLSKLGARVVWGAQERIREVMRCVRGVSDVVPRDDSTEFDYHLPLLDAPLMLGTTLDNIPGAHCLEISDTWPRWEPPEGTRKPKVAIVWAGSPLHGRDRARSITAEMYQPIIDAHPEIQFYSLQIGPRAPEVSVLKNVIDLAPTIKNGWTDTAQALKWIDLLVSVDTACVHLAGAVDTAAWMLAPNSPDWRWLLGRDDSPWYPKLRLFRQPNQNDWSTPLAAIDKALSDL
jgi:tetratricopeptide (TPR) repeat protein